MPRTTFLPRVYGEGPEAQTPSVPSVPPVNLNLAEAELFWFAINDAGQFRDQLILHGTLCQAARAKARDMAQRDYFAHTDPDGYGPNYRVRELGYKLPDHYGTAPAANNIESIGGGYPTSDLVWQGWKNSPGHRVHVLGENDFYREQTNIGIGYWHDPDSVAVHYWVFHSAP